MSVALLKYLRDNCIDILVGYSDVCVERQMVSLPFGNLSEGFHHAKKSDTLYSGQSSFRFWKRWSEVTDGDIRRDINRNDVFTNERFAIFDAIYPNNLHDKKVVIVSNMLIIKNCLIQYIWYDVLKF